MKQAKAIHWVVPLALVACLGGWLSASAQNPPARLTINDNFMPSSQLLFSDGNVLNHPDLGAMYVDWRLADGDPCVFGWVKKDGFFFIYTNRGNNLDTDCELNFPLETHRRYLLKLPDAAICTGLGLGAAPCEARADRARAEALFRSKAKETTVAFMFHLGGNSYSVDTSGDISGSGDTRTLTNTARTATLRNVTARSQVGAPFVFVFQLTVTRVVQ